MKTSEFHSKWFTIQAEITTLASAYDAVRHTYPDAADELLKTANSIVVGMLGLPAPPLTKPEDPDTHKQWRDEALAASTETS